jgi:hypothetical protein
VTGQTDAFFFNLYGDGLNDYEVAAISHVGRNKLRSWRVLHGVPSKTKKKGLTTGMCSVIKKLLNEGATLTDIGKKYGVCRTAISRLLRKNGISYVPYRPNHPSWATSYALTDLQKQMLYGDLFGDGHLASTSKDSAYYVCAHSLYQESFVFWKYLILGPLSSNFHKGTTYHKSYGKKYPYVSMNTWTNRELGDLRKLFYPGGEKYLRPELLSEFTPMSLATWYMGDGSLNRNTGVFHVGLNVELDSIAVALSDRFQVHFKAMRYEKQWHLRVMDPHKFFDIVRPYILPYFSYKIKTY